MIFVLALCFCTVIPAFAVDADGFVSEYERVQDMAKLLSESEREALIKTLDELSERQKMDVIVVTTNTLDGKKPMEYADDIYDYCKYGYGEKRDGLLFLVSMEENLAPESLCNAHHLSRNCRIIGCKVCVTTLCIGYAKRIACG